MPACHKCPHQQEIDRLRTICAACPGASELSRSHVSLNASPDGTGDKLISREGVAPEWFSAKSASHESKVDLPPVARDYLFRVLREFSSLSDGQAVIVCRMLRGETITQMARSMKISKVAVFARWKSLCDRSPVWASLANGSMGLRGGGRKPRQK